MKARNPCAMRPIGSVGNLTENVKTEISVYNVSRNLFTPCNYLLVTVGSSVLNLNPRSWEAV